MILYILKIIFIKIQINLCLKLQILGSNFRCTIKDHYIQCSTMYIMHIFLFIGLRYL